MMTMSKIKTKKRIRNLERRVVALEVAVSRAAGSWPLKDPQPWTNQPETTETDKPDFPNGESREEVRLEY